MKITDSWQLRFSRVPQLDLELLEISNVNYEYPPHLHECFSIGVMLNGVEQMRFGPAMFTALPGSLLLINAEEVHSNISIDTSYRILKLPRRVLTQIAAEIGEPVRPHFPTPVVDDLPGSSALLNLCRTLEQKTSHLEAESELFSTVGELLTRHGETRGCAARIRKEPRAVGRARDYLKSRYAHNVSLGELAALAGSSRFHLLRAFRKEMGVPPHEYQTQVRIAHARQLIRSGQSLAEAALQTGFCDQSHLSRHFKRIVGMTPGQYVSHSNIVQDPHSSIR